MQPYARVISTDFTYTGQRDLPDTGLMDYHARFYSPSLGRFIQPDTIIPGMANPQSWNRYSYVTNNPINYNDPTGHMMANDDGGGVSCTVTNTCPVPGGGGGGGGGCNVLCELNNELNGLSEVVDPLYDIFGSNSELDVILICFGTVIVGAMITNLHRSLAIFVQRDKRNYIMRVSHTLVNCHGCQ